MPKRFQRQVAPGRTTATLPFANASDFGGQIGEAIGSAGDQFGRQAAASRRIEVERERDKQSTQAMVDFAELQERYGTAEIDARLNAAPGAAGHIQQMDEVLAKEQETFLGSIADEKVRNRYRARFAQWQSSKSIAAEGFERGETVKLMVTNADTAVNIKANQLSRPTATNEDFSAATIELREGVGGLEGVPADIRLQMEKDGVATLSASFLKGRPPEQAKAMIASGAFDGFLTPPQLQQIENGADIDMRRLKMEADARARLEKADAREELDQLMREISDGVPKSDEEMAAAQAQAERYGFDKSRYDLGKARVEGSLNREYRSATPQQIDAAIKTFDARIAKAGDKASAQDVVARDHLENMLGTRTKDVARDPLAAGAKMGIDVQPIDWASGDSIASRRRSADASAKALGVPPVYLTDEEAAQMKAQLDTPAGMLEVSRQLKQLGGVASRRAAQQIDPGNQWFHASLGLNPNARQMVYNGDKLLSTKQISVKATDTQERWREHGLPAMQLLPTEAKGAVLQMAVRIYANDAVKLAKDEFDPDLFDGAINAAVGAFGRNGQKTGGIGEWNGEKLILPSGMTQDRFDWLFGKINFSKSTNRPRYGNGEDIPSSVLRDDWTPVLAPSGRYRFQNRRGEYAVASGGSPYELDFDVLDRRLPANIGTAPKRRTGR